MKKVGHVLHLIRAMMKTASVINSACSASEVGWREVGGPAQHVNKSVPVDASVTSVGPARWTHVRTIQ